METTARTFQRLFLMLLAAVAASACSPLTVINAVSSSRHYERAADIAYGDEERQRLDVYRPLGVSAETPLVVYFYGGGWDDGAKEQHEFVAASLTRAGFAVVIPDYRLYPEVRYPAFVEDGAKALAWVIDNAGRHGLPSERIYLMGHSAGAHLAALIALDGRYLAAHGDGPAILAGFIGLSGPYDFLPLESEYLKAVFPEETRAESQPINYVSGRAPPALLIHGQGDKLVENGNSERLATRLRDAGVPVTLKLYQGVGHARVLVALAPPLDFIAATLDDCVAFIRATEASARPAAGISKNPNLR